MSYPAKRPDLIPSGSEPQRFRCTAPATLGYRPHPIGDVLSPKLWERNYQNGAFFRQNCLEGLTKEYQLDLLLGETLVPLVGDTYILRTVDYVQVKGKTKPLEAFTVMGEGASQTASMPVRLAGSEEGVRLYRNREFVSAARAFEQCLRKHPDDYLSAMYLKRCQVLIETPPNESWDGVFVMTKK